MPAPETLGDREAPDELRRLSEELDGAKRELELAFARERAMVAHLRDRDELRDQFVGNVVHELRTPLTAIRGYSELLLRPQDSNDEKVRARAGAILRAADQLRGLIQDLLDMTTVDGAALRVVPQDLDLRQAVGAALDLARPLAAEKDIALSSEIPAELPGAHADPERLAQVLNNLLSNAIKFTPRGGRIAVTARGGGDLLHVEVRDTGIGIALAEQRQVFERFFHATTTDASEHGLGLGLYIVRAIVEAHGGLVWFESESGKGTTFHFTLPLAAAVEPTARAAS